MIPRTKDALRRSLWVSLLMVAVSTSATALVHTHPNLEDRGFNPPSIELRSLRARAYPAQQVYGASGEVAYPRLGTNAMTVGPVGGNFSVMVFSRGSWNAAANDPFLHVTTESANGTGSRIAEFTCDAFTDTGMRVGTLTIAGVTLTVTQAGTNYLGPDSAITLMPTGLNNPSDVAVDAFGDVYISDTHSNTIKKWNPSSQQTTTLVSTGLRNPTGIAVDRAGNVYIADTLNNAVKVWNATTQELNTLVSQGLNNPSSIAVDRFGNVFIADSGNNAIKKWSATTLQVITVVGDGLNLPSGVAVDGLGNVFIADSLNNAIKEWNASTRQVLTIVSEGLNHPNGVAVDNLGNIYIADSANNAIKKWSFTTLQTDPLVAAGLNNPNGVAVDGSGAVYIADTFDGAIKEFPSAFVGPASFSESAAAGSDSLLRVLPTDTSLHGVFTPTSDQDWLTVESVAGGVINFSFAANPSASERLAHMTVLGRIITITQSGPIAQNTPDVSPATIPSPNVSAPSIRTSLFSPAAQHLTRQESALITCLPPVGSTFSESFGDSAQACSFTGSSGCNWPWHLTGTGATIVSSPGTPDPNTACGQSLQMITGTANNYISTAGPTPTVPAGTTTDTTIYVYPISTTLGAFSAQTLYVQSPTANGSNFPCRIDWHTSTLGTIAVRGEGATAGADTANLSLNAWHTIAMHCASGTGNSFVTLDGGPSQTFTAQAFPWNYQTIGAIGGQTQSITYAVGNIAVSSSIQGGNPPITYVNFGGAPVGATVTSAILNSATVCGNGSWQAQAAGSPATAETISSAFALPLVGSVTSCGTNYADSTGSPVFRFDLSQAVAEEARYFWQTYSPSVSVGFWFATTVPTNDTGYYSGWGIENVLGSDFVALMGHSGQFYIETQSNPNGLPTVGSPFNYTPNTKYFIAIQFNEYQNASTVHTLQIYDSACNLLSTQQKLAQSSNPSLPSFWFAGRGGDEDTPAASWYINNIAMDYVSGNIVQCQRGTPQSIAFVPLSDQVFGSAPFTVTATATSGLPVSFASMTPAVCSVAGSTVALAETGTCTIEATQGGNSNYAPAPPVDQSFQVTPESQTISFGSLASEPIGTPPFMITATATSGLTVTFSSITPATCGVSGATVTLLTAGSCTIQAGQGGNANFSAAAPVNQSFQIAQGNQAITFAQIPTKAFGTTPFSLSATATSDLPVSFVSMTPTVCSVSGDTVSLIALGPCEIEALQAGNGVYAPASPVSQSFQVVQETLGTTSLTLGSSAATGSVEIGFIPFNGQAAWAAVTNTPWLHLAGGSANGVGSAIVQFAIDANAGPSVRSGAINLDSGLTLTVTQAGPNYLAPGAIVTLASWSPGAPNGIAVDGSGNLYVADTLNNCITKWSAATQTLSTLVSTGLNSPTSVALDGMGNVYIADSLNNAIKMWNSSTQQLTSLVSTGLNGPTGIAVDNSGNVYIADTLNNAIKEWNASSQQVTTLVASGLNNPAGVAVDSSGNVYIADTLNNAIREWNASSQQVTTLVTLGLNRPNTVAVDGSGSVYIADSMNNAIEKRDASTQQVVPLIASGLKNPNGVAADGAGDVYIADTLNSSIKVIPNVFVGPSSVIEPVSSGTDSLLPMLPATASLSGVFAPTSDQTWLTLSGEAGGVISFSFTANSSSGARTAHLNVLGQTITVTQNGSSAQTITFGALSNQTFGTAPFLLNATASSGLPVSFASTTSSICTVSGSTVTLVAVGSCTIQATQGGNSDYAAAAPVNQSFQVTSASQTISFGALANLAFGAPPFSVNATATSGLAVSFSSLSVSVCTMSGSTVTLIGVGTCTIQATQAGNSTYTAATPVNQSFQVAQAAQSITFAALTSRALGSAPFTVSASASSGLTVSFSSVTPTVCTLSGTTVTLVAVGNCTIQAVQAGNSNYAPAAPVNQTFQVTTASQTITFGPLANRTYGSATFTLSATATSGLAVSFSSLTAGVCTVSGTTAKLVAAGTCTIQATQAGNANYAAAAAVNQSFQVTQASQTITFGTLSNKTYGAAPFRVSATASSGLAVSFSSQTSGVCSISGSTVTLIASGTCTIQATQAGNANFAPATPVVRSFTVAQASQTINFPKLSTHRISNGPFAVSATASSGLAVSFASTTTTVCRVSGTTVTLLAQGTCTIQASQAGNANYAAATPVKQSFQVSR